MGTRPSHEDNSQNRGETVTIVVGEAIGLMSPTTMATRLRPRANGARKSVLQDGDRVLPRRLCICWEGTEGKTERNQK
jgi:hypothetical protein